MGNDKIRIDHELLILNNACLLPSDKCHLRDKSCQLLRMGFQSFSQKLDNNDEDMVTGARRPELGHTLEVPL